MPNYQFFGSPVSQAAAVAAHRNEQDRQARVGAAQAQAAGAVQAAQQNAYSTLYQQPADAYTAYASGNAAANNAYQQGLGGVAGAQSGLYQNYGNNLANMYSNRMGSMGMAEVARQTGLANLGTAALSSGGQASAAALGAWGQNQASFAKSMADAAAANQAALMQYGVGRDSALASLGTSIGNYGTGLNRAWTDAQSAANNYSRDLNKLGVARDLGIGQLGVSSQVAGNMPAMASGLGNAIGGVSSAIGNTIGQFTGADPQPYTPSLSPSYPVSPRASLPGYGWSPTQYGDQPGNMALLGLSQGASDTFRSLADARRGIENTSILDSLNANNAAARQQLDSAYYSSRNQPSQMLGQSLGAFDSMMRTAGRGLNAGMDQFYASMPTGYEDRLRDGLAMGSGALTGLAGQMGTAFRDTAANNQRGYDTFGSQFGGLLDRVLPPQAAAAQRPVGANFRPRVVRPVRASA